MGGILEAFLAGKEARRVADAQEQINAMQAFIGQNGAAIMGGDANALGQLAGFGQQGLQMAMGIQGDVQARERQAALDAQAADDRAYTRTRQEKADQRSDQKWEMELAEYKKGLSAEQAATEAAQLEEAAKMALTATSAEQWDQLATENGAPELVGQFDNREAVAARFMSMAEVLKQTNPEGPEWRTATPEEAAGYGASAGQISTKTGEFKKTGDGNGIFYTTTNADGTTTTVQVGGKPGAGGKPMTEAQSKDNVFVTRAKGALAKLESPLDPKDPDGGTVASSLSSLGDTMAGYVPILGNYMQSDAYQVAKTAGDEFLQAVLRKDTGAAITVPEQKLYGETYLPQPGDSEARLKYKAEARARAVAAMESGMSEQQIEAVTRALSIGDTAAADKILQDAGVSAGAASEAAGAAPPPQGTTPPAPADIGLSADDLKYLDTP